MLFFDQLRNQCHHQLVIIVIKVLNLENQMNVIKAVVITTIVI